MKTQSVNSLAEEFEVDRGTLVRALKNTPPDAEKTLGRPTYKISTAANALEAHRRSVGRLNSPNSRSDGGSAEGGWQDPTLTRIYSDLHAAEAAMRALPSLDQRRKAAVSKMAPLISRMAKATLERGKANGLDPGHAELLSDKLYFLALRGLEEPCGWTQSETWAAMNAETD